MLGISEFLSFSFKLTEETLKYILHSIFCKSVGLSNCRTVGLSISTQFFFVTVHLIKSIYIFSFSNEFFPCTGRLTHVELVIFILPVSTREGEVLATPCSYRGNYQVRLFSSSIKQHSITQSLLSTTVYHSLSTDPPIILMY